MRSKVLQQEPSATTLRKPVQLTGRCGSFVLPRAPPSVLLTFVLAVLPLNGAALLPEVTLRHHDAVRAVVTAVHGVSVQLVQRPVGREAEARLGPHRVPELAAFLEVGEHDEAPNPVEAARIGVIRFQLRVGEDLEVLLRQPVAVPGNEL